MQGVQETRNMFVLLSAFCLMGKCEDEDIALKCCVKGTWQCTGSTCLSLGHPLALVPDPF